MIVETRHFTINTHNLTIDMIQNHFKEHLNPNENVIRWAVVKYEKCSYLVEFAVVVD